MKINQNKYRLEELIQKIRSGEANQEEKDEYIEILKQEKCIKDDSYKRYKSNIDTDIILKYSLIAAAGLLLIWGFSEYMKSKK
jgi:hypothetical protein